LKETNGKTGSRRAFSRRHCKLAIALAHEREAKQIHRLTRNVTADHGKRLPRF
jgi:hypothetical protein